MLALSLKRPLVAIVAIAFPQFAIPSDRSISRLKVSPLNYVRRHFANSSVSDKSGSQTSMPSGRRQSSGVPLGAKPSPFREPMARRWVFLVRSI